jgi:hypothetical protein
VGRGGISPGSRLPDFQVRGDLSFSTMLKEYVQQDPVGHRCSRTRSGTSDVPAGLFRVKVNEN